LSADERELGLQGCARVGRAIYGDRAAEGLDVDDGGVRVLGRIGQRFGDQ
jgi:hypothetical protein